MRTILPLMLLAFSVPALAQTAVDLPKRDAGLWEMKTSMAELGGMGMSFQVCLDDSIDDLFTSPEDDMNCSEKSYWRDGGTVHFKATCTVEGSTARVNGRFSGEFRRSYSGEVHTTYSPPLQGMNTTTLGVQARWLSACRAGQKPGDVEMMGMPGMGNINLDALMKNLPQLQR
jgi:hypothetical protein